MKLMRGLLGALSGALGIGVTEVAAQQIITTCGASAGYGYYLEPTPDGWIKDAISTGTLTFTRDATGAYDVIIKDALTTFSAKADGAQVVKVHGSDDQAFTLVAVYPLTVTEVYQLTLDQGGRGTLIWASLKNRVPPLGVTKGSVFNATCSK
jgi:hypothetical protein